MRKEIKYSLIIPGALIFASIVYIFLMSNYGTIQLKERGDSIAAKINQFKKDKGYLPNSLDDIGIKETEEGPLYYGKEDSTQYIIWFGTTLGKSCIYYSKTNKWTEDH